MDNGFSLQDAMNLIDVKEKKESFQSIRRRLLHGEQLSDFFAEYLPKSYSTYFSGFIQWLPFLESLLLTSRIRTKEIEQTKAMIKGMIYPMILLLGVLAGILVFNTTVLPEMLSMMSGFGLEGDSYKKAAEVITISTKVFVVIAGFSVLVAMIALSKRNIVKTYQLLSRILPDSILAGSASSDFARFYLECVRMKIPTRESLSILKNIQEKPLVQFIAQELDSSLQQGKAMEKAIDSPYVEKALSRFFRIAIYASNCEQMLEGYLKMVQMRSEVRIKRFTKVVQCCAYLTIGIVVIFVYQILMMPMTMIQTM